MGSQSYVQSARYGSQIAEVILAVKLQKLVRQVIDN